MTPPRMAPVPHTLRRAVDLMPDDVCVGPAIFTEYGVVESTTVVDAGVQINWKGGSHTTRPEDYELRVVAE